MLNLKNFQREYESWIEQANRGIVKFIVLSNNRAHFKENTKLIPNFPHFLFAFFKRSGIFTAQ